MNPQPVGGISVREELARYACRNDGEDDPQLETKLADCKERLAMFQKMAETQRFAELQDTHPENYANAEY